MKKLFDVEKGVVPTFHEKILGPWARGKKLELIEQRTEILIKSSIFHIFVSFCTLNAYETTTFWLET